MARKPQGLSLRQLRFVEIYADPNSTTFGNPVTSYIAAGYKDGPGNAQSACRLLNSVKIAKEIERFRCELRQDLTIKQRITSEYADQKTVDLFERAVEAKEWMVQLGCVRLFQQRCGNLDTKIAVDINSSIKIEEKYKADLDRIARIAIREKLFDMVEDDQGTQDVVDGSGNNSVIIDAESVNVADTETYGE